MAQRPARKVISSLAFSWRRVSGAWWCRLLRLCRLHSHRARGRSQDITDLHPRPPPNHPSSSQVEGQGSFSCNHFSVCGVERPKSSQICSCHVASMTSLLSAFRFPLSAVLTLRNKGEERERRRCPGITPHPCCGLQEVPSTRRSGCASSSVRLCLLLLRGLSLALLRLTALLRASRPLIV